MNPARWTQIYRNFYLNLTATGSLDPTEGLFFPRSHLSFAPCLVEVGKGEDVKSMALTYESKLERNTESVLLTRAWEFQEWMLSPRILFFGREEIH